MDCSHTSVKSVAESHISDQPFQTAAGYIVEDFAVAYTSENFKTKKALKEAVAKGERITVFQPGLGTVPENGTIAIEGPHYPKPHTWYGTATIENGVVVKVV